MNKSVQEKSVLIDRFFKNDQSENQKNKIKKVIEKYLEAGNITGKKDLKSIFKELEFKTIPQQPVSLDEFIDEITNKVLPGSINTGSPYFIGHMTSLLPDFIKSLAEFIVGLNQNLVKIETAKSATVYERNALAMLHHLIYNKSEKFYNEHIYDSKSTLGIITSGGTIANLTALQCARNLSLNPQKGNIERFGLAESIKKNKISRHVIICSKIAHYSIEKTMGVLGLGSKNLLRIDVDENNKMKIDLLKKALEKCKAEKANVVAIIATAGTTECGSIDPLNDLADIAEENRIHLHVDAAWGGAVLLSKKYKHLLSGIERADTVTIDGHKQLYLPMGIGMVFFRNPKMAYIIEKHSEYIIRKNSLDLGRRSIEGSRPGMVFYLQAALNLLGLRGYELLINHGIEITREMAALIKKSGDFELLINPETNILLYRYLPSKYRSLKKYTDRENRVISRFNIELQELQLKQGNSFVSRTSIKLQSFGPEPITALRVVLANPMTAIKHIESILSEQRNLAKEIFI